MGPTPTVLYADDEESDRFFMRRAFKASGLEYSLQTVSDGQEAIDYLSGAGPYSQREKHPVPDLVLLDLKMPMLSGFEVLEWIRKQPAYMDLPVAIFSSSSHPGDRKLAETLGADEYWEKPSSAHLYADLVSGWRQRWLTPSGVTG
jgi:CheY-like chemotaxis protein